MEMPRGLGWAGGRDPGGIQFQIIVLPCFAMTGESPVLRNVEAGAEASLLPPQQRELTSHLSCPLRVGNKIKVPKT